MRNGDGYFLFLDFDGVLITKFSDSSGTHVGQAFDPVCVEQLRMILEYLRSEYGTAAIVVTSHWRFELDEGELRRILLEQQTLGLRADQIYCIDRHLNKRDGIRQFIEAHIRKGKAYAILDDEDLGPELAVRLIRTRSEDGLRGLQAEAVSNLFKRRSE